jgi:hypothetical protein
MTFQLRCAGSRGIPGFHSASALVLAAGSFVLGAVGSAGAGTIAVPADHATITAALAMASAGDTVSVAAGLYAASANSETFPLAVAEGVSLIGAGLGLSVLDAEADSVQVVRMEGSGRLSGFTVTGGRSVRGAGVFVGVGSPEVDHNLITGNGASSAGAGVFSLGGTSPWIHHNVVWENFDTVPEDAVDPHGLLFQNDASGTVEHNLIGRMDGNGLLTSGSATPSVRHNLFLENGAEGPPARGRGICWLSDQPAGIFHNLFHDNLLAALLWTAGGGDVTGLAANEVAPDDGVYGNLDGDPLLADPDGLDFSLTPGSPAVDAGDPTLPLDPDGTVADLGPFYLDQTAVDVPAPALRERWASARPNPFRARTRVVWDGTAGPVAVAVFDVRGVQVRDLGESRSGGSEWDGRDDDGRPVPSGVYWARVTSPDRQTSVPMLRLR